MHRHLIHILIFCFVTRISGEKPKKVDAKIERRQGMVDMRYEYPHAAFLNGFQGTFGISGDQYDANPDEAGLGIILGAKSLINGHYQNALSRPVQVVPFAVHQPVAVPVPSYRAIPVANIRPGASIQRPIPVHYPSWKDQQRVNLHRNQYHGQNGLKVKKYTIAGKAPLQTGVKYTSVVNQEPNYIVFHGNSDATAAQPSLGSAYQDAANAVLTNNVFAVGFPAPQVRQETLVPQYITPHIKLHQVSSKSSGNGEPAQGLGQYATTHNTLQYEYPSSRAPAVYGTTPSYDYSSGSYETSNGNSEYDSKQNVKPQTYTSLIETKNSAQDDSNGSNAVPSSNYEQYVPNYETYEDRQSTPESYSEQFQYQYYSSGNNQEADSESQSSNQVKYGTAQKYQQRYF